MLRCLFFYGLTVIENGMVLLLCLGALWMSFPGRMTSWLCSLGPTPLNLNLACQFNSVGTTEPRPQGRMLCKKPLGLGDSPSTGQIRPVTEPFRASLSLSINREEWLHVYTQVRGRRDEEILHRCQMRSLKAEAATSPPTWVPVSQSLFNFYSSTWDTTLENGRERGNMGTGSDRLCSRLALRSLATWLPSPRSQFLHLENGNKSKYHCRRLLWGTNEMGQSLALTGHPKSGQMAHFHPPPKHGAVQDLGSDWGQKVPNYPEEVPRDPPLLLTPWERLRMHGKPSEISSAAKKYHTPVTPLPLG